MTLASSLVIAIIFASGTFLLLQRDITRVIVGVVLISNSAILFLIMAGLSRGEAPIYPLPDGGEVSDPLVQAMALTAIVIGFGAAALVMAMVYRLYTSHQTVDLEDIAMIEMRESESLERPDDLPENEEMPEESPDEVELEEETR